MSVFSKISEFLNKHRNKFFVGGVVVTGSVLLTRYAQHKIREWQENETKDYFERARKHQHFESTERTCNQTMLNLINALNDALTKVVNTEEIIEELRYNPSNRVELWDKLKILVFTKVTCLIYTATLLITMLRIQMNIIGGYLYKDPTCVTLEIQEKYLLLCHGLLESGMESLAQLFKEEYDKILGVIPLKRQLKLDNLEKIFWAIQMAVQNNNADPIRNFKKIVDIDYGTDEKDIYSCMLRDTADLLDSDEVRSLAVSNVSKAFVLLSDQIAEFYTPSPSSSSEETFVHPADIKIPLAKLIPVVNGLISKNSFPDLLIQQLITNDKLKVLGANIYEAFS